MYQCQFLFFYHLLYLHNDLNLLYNYDFLIILLFLKWLLFKLLIIYLKTEPEPVCYRSSTFQDGISILRTRQHIPVVLPH